MERDGTLRRLFAEDLAADSVELTEAEAHHALRVLRLEDGAEVEVFDGRGGVALGRLRPRGRRGAVVEITGRREARPVRPAVELAFACPKGKRLDWLIEKAVELGAAALRPVVFERSVAGRELSPHAAGRWRDHCIAAAKQSGADFLPRIDRPTPLPALLAEPAANLALLGQAGGEPAGPILAGAGPVEAVALLVGPEGGLTPEEAQAAGSSGWLPVSVGPLTLRVETAAVSLLAAVRACGGRQSGPSAATITTHVTGSRRSDGP
jgi:16S rRNA (uracil1498-N3)-methyltransferase